MKIETFLVCESAADYSGRLCILGAFDVITSSLVPVTSPSLSIAVRGRFEQVEKGKHEFLVNIEKENEPESIVELKGEIEVVFDQRYPTSTVNMIFNLQRITFKTFGKYNVNIFIDNIFIDATPLYIVTDK